MKGDADFSSLSQRGQRVRERREQKRKQEEAQVVVHGAALHDS